MDLKDYVHSLATKGQSFFSEDEALKETGLSKTALKPALNRLKKNKK